jgi:hypothetical protein
MTALTFEGAIKDWSAWFTPAPFVHVEPDQLDDLQRQSALEILGSDSGDRTDLRRLAGSTFHSLFVKWDGSAWFDAKEMYMTQQNQRGRDQPNQQGGQGGQQGGQSGGQRE